MPRGKNTASAKPLPPPDIDAIERSVRSQRALSRSALLRTLGTTSRRAAVEEQLVKRGLERTDSWLRVPLLDQVFAQLDAKGPVPERVLFTAVKGATRDELRALRGKLFAEGQLVHLWTDKGFRVARPAATQLDRGVIASAVKQMKWMLARWGKLEGTERVDRDTFVRALAEMLRPFGSTPGPARGLEESDTEAMVLRAIDAHAVTDQPFVSVPAVVAALEPGVARSAVHDVLLSLARSGVIELRPESGMGLLSEQDRARCPVNALGAVLRWARRSA